MKRLHLFAAVLVIVNLTGCAILDFRPQPTDRQIDAWIAEEEYGKALEALENLPKDHPRYDALSQRRAQVRLLADEYEREALAEAHQRAVQGDLLGAIDTLDSALLNLPDSERLSQHRIELRQRHVRRVHKLAAHASIAKAQWLLRELPLRREQAHVDPNDLSAQWELEEALEDMQEVAHALIKCARHGLEDQDPALAKRCLVQARHLEPDETLQRSIRELDKAVAQFQAVEQSKRKRVQEAAQRQQRLARARERKRAEQQRSEKAEQLKGQARRSLERRELQRAKTLTDELLRLKPDDPDVLRLHERTKALIALRVQQKLERGNALYRQEKVKSAKKAWEEALALDPDNQELQAHIDRAERVLKNLEELRKSGSVVN